MRLGKIVVKIVVTVCFVPAKTAAFVSSIGNTLTGGKSFKYKFFFAHSL